MVNGPSWTDLDDSEESYVAVEDTGDADSIGPPDDPDVDERCGPAEDGDVTTRDGALDDLEDIDGGPSIIPNMWRFCLIYSWRELISIMQASNSGVAPVVKPKSDRSATELIKSCSSCVVLPLFIFNRHKL